RPDAGAQCRDEQPDFVVGQHLVVARFLGVDDLAAQRQHGLRASIASLLGRAAGRRALDQEQLAVLRIALRALGELGGEPFVVHAFLSGQLARLPGGLARLGGPDALVGDLPRRRRIFLEGLGELVVHDLLTSPLMSLLPSLALVCPSNCGSGRRTETTAVRPSRTSSPLTPPLKLLRNPLACA